MVRSCAFRFRLPPANAARNSSNRSTRRSKITAPPCATSAETSRKPSTNWRRTRRSARTTRSALSTNSKNSPTPKPRKSKTSPPPKNEKSWSCSGRRGRWQQNKHLRLVVLHRAQECVVIRRTFYGYLSQHKIDVPRNGHRILVSVVFRCKRGIISRHGSRRRRLHRRPCRQRQLQACLHVQRRPQLVFAH